MRACTGLIYNSVFRVQRVDGNTIILQKSRTDSIVITPLV